MNVPLKKIAIALVPLFIVACASKPYERERPIDERFNIDDCSGYRHMVKERVRGKGEDAKVLEELNRYWKLFLVDGECIDKRGSKETNLAVLNARLGLKKEAIKGVLDRLALQLQSPYMPADAKREIVEQFLSDLNSAIPDVANVTQEAFEQSRASQEGIVKFHITDLLTFVENGTPLEKKEAIAELASIDRGEAFDQNLTLSNKARDILRKDIEGFDLAKETYKASMPQTCDSGVDEDGQFWSRCVTRADFVPN